MIKKLLLVFLLALPCVAQVTGNITASGSTCATTNACVSQQLSASAASAGVTISGTWSATLQFEVSNDNGATWAAANATPPGSTTAVTSTTANGTWRINVAGMTNVHVRGSALASGTAQVTITFGSGSASTGSGGGSGTVTNAASLTLNHVMLGAGTNAAAVDSALVTDGAGALSGATSLTVAAGGNVGSADTGTPKFTFGTNLITASQPIVAPSISTGTAPTACGSATGCVGATAADVVGNNVAGQFYSRAALTGTKYLFNFGSGEVPLNAASGGTGSAFFTVAGPTAARTYTFPDAAATIASGAGTTGTFPKYTTGESAILGNSLLDDGVTTANALTYAGTAGVRSPAFTATGTTAGFEFFPQGTANSGAPCVAVNVICWEAPPSVTAYKGIHVGAAATGLPHYANASNVITETISAIADADLTGQVGVAHGGTGLGTLTAHSLYVGNGTTAPNAVGLGTTVTVLHGNASADPAYAVITPADASGNTSGSGNFALVTSPVFTTPSIGTATTTSIIGAANTAVIVQGGLDATTTGASGTLTARGEDVTGGSTASLTGGATTVRGGNNASTGASGTAGALALQAGSITGAATNLAAADASLAGGLGTGNAAVSHVKIQSPALGLASGTSAQSLVTRWVNHTKAGSTTSATATTLFNIASATNTAWGVEVTVHVDLISSTPNVCGTTETFSLTGTNNNGAFGTVNIVAGTLSTLCSAGTLTLAVTATAANPSVISVTPTWATITSITSATITVQIRNVSQQEISLL